MSCKCLLEDLEEVVAGDLRTDIQVEGTVKVLSVQGLDTGTFCVHRSSAAWFRGIRTMFSIVEEFQLPQSQRLHFYWWQISPSHLSEVHPT
jgi:hypothetical protein